MFCFTIHDSQPSSSEKYTKLKLGAKQYNVVRKLLGAQWIIFHLLKTHFENLWTHLAESEMESSQYSGYQSVGEGGERSEGLAANMEPKIGWDY